MSKKLLIGAVLSTTALTFATNGVNLIGFSPASRAMGGLSVGTPVNPVESIIRNPASMGNFEGKFFTEFGGTLFLPSVKSRADVPGGPSETSKADRFLIPEFGIVHNITESLTFGLGAFGVSGLGVDYREPPNSSTPFAGMSYFQLMKLVPAISYRVNEMISIGAGLHTSIGLLDLGKGSSQSLGFGVQVGAFLNMGDFIFGGISYQSPVAMTYKRVFDSDSDGNNEDLKLTQPQEAALGIGASPLDGLTVGLDLRWINWKGAQGYKDFKWNDQIVFAVGLEYMPTESISLRLGYNQGDSPIKSVSGACTNPSTCPNKIPDLNATFPDYSVYAMNLIYFPAIAKQHITVGVGFQPSERVGIDLSYVRALDSEVKLTPDSISPTTAPLATKMSQNSLSFAVNWKF